MNARFYWFWCEAILLLMRGIGKCLYDALTWDIWEMLLERMATFSSSQSKGVLRRKKRNTYSNQSWLC